MADHRSKYLYICGLIDTVLGGRPGVIAMLDGHFMDGFFDESGTHDQAAFGCVAGFLFKPTKYKRFEAAWRRRLHKDRIKCFHATDCHAQEGEFKKWKDTPHRSDKLMLDLAKIAVKYSENGFAVMVARRSFERQRSLVSRSQYTDFYSLCVHLTVGQVRDWAERERLPEDLKVAYFFETGHAAKSEANNFLDRIGNRPEAKLMFRYGSHTFIPKDAATGLQAADLLAWELRNAYEISAIPTRSKIGRESLWVLAEESEVLPLRYQDIRKLLTASEDLPLPKAKRLQGKRSKRRKKGRR